MEMPKKIQDLAQREYDRQCGGDHFQTLHRRKDRENCSARGDRNKKLEPLPFEAQEQVYAHWYAFHDGIPYQDFATFYSKSSFCSSHLLQQLSDEKFLQLISDRTFLFLEFNEHRSGWAKPSLRTLCIAPSANDKKNAGVVLQKGFEPTYGHRDDLNEMLEHSRQLCQALEVRKRCLQKYKNSPQQRAAQKKDVISIPIKRGRAPNERANQLSALFHAYLEKTISYAYQEDYRPYIASPVHHWAEEMAWVLHELECRSIPLEPALVFYCLFTNCTKRLASKKLSRFTYGDRPKKDAQEPPEEVQQNVSQRNYCNIMLYDRLTELFAPLDLDYTNFCFYALTKFQHYTHFQPLNRKEHGQDQTTFQPNLEMMPNHAEGVDQLGHLLRRNIFFCIPNRLEWMTPDLWFDSSQIALDLVVRLLRDSEIQQSAFRLTNRVRSFLKKNDAVLEAYIRVRENTSGAEAWLNEVCQKQGFLFDGEMTQYECPFSVAGKPNYGRFVLEFELKERVIELCREKLLHSAQTRFQTLFCAENPLTHL